MKLVLVILLLTVTAAASQRTETPEVLLQSAIQKEIVDGDLRTAIGMYEKIAAMRGVSRAVASQALLYMGRSYEKLGSAEATKAYTRVVRDYADRQKEAAEARTRLAELTKTTGGSAAPALAVRQIWTGREVDILGQPSPDGRMLSFVDWETGDQAVRDLSTGKSRRLTKKGTWFDSIEFSLFSTFSPDGKQLAYAWFNEKLFFDLRIMPVDGSTPRIVYSNSEVEYLQPYDWSPDGKHILATLGRSDRTTQIVLVNTADGSARTLKTLDWRSPITMNFSPDGRYIVYDFPQDEDSRLSDIFLLASDGSREIRLIQHPSNDSGPVWTPDGNMVIFASDRSGSTGAWMIRVADGKPQGTAQLIKQDIGRTLPLGITRSGTFFYGLVTGMNDVYIATLDLAAGHAQQPSTLTQKFVGTNISPDWSRDGKYLAYLSRRSPSPVESAGATILVIRSAEGNEERELAPLLNYFNRPRWSPDGRFILVDGSDQKGRQGIYKIDVRNGDAIPVVYSEPGKSIGKSMWSPDGRTIYFKRTDSAAKSVSIVKRDLETNQETELRRGPVNAAVDDPVLSPDGRQLAFTVIDLTAGATSLNVMPTAGGESKELFRVQKPESVSDGEPLSWTPDGRSLLFVRSTSEAPQRQLWRIPAEGGTPVSLGLTMDGLRSVRVHPDGRQLSFGAGQNRFEIWVMENFLKP